MKSKISFLIILVVVSSLWMPAASGRPADDLDPAMMEAVLMAEELLGLEIPITSGRRSSVKQQQLWNNRHNNPYPVARPGTSRHELGLAIDVPSWFAPILLSVAAEVGICQPLPFSDPIHFILCNDKAARQQAIDRSVSQVEAQLRAPGWKIWPNHDKHQVVGLPSWLYVTDNWETRTAVVTAGTVRATTRAVPVESVWTFTEKSTGNVEVIRCPNRGNEWTTGAAGMPLCGKAWTHSSDVTGVVEVGVEIVYKVTTSTSFGDDSATSTVTSRRSETRELLVGEVQTWGITDQSNERGDGI